MSIIQEIAAERCRQMSAEGWTPAHDDEHEDYALSDAASAYCVGHKYSLTPPSKWPWPEKWWKPTTHRRNLIKAAALIIAEIERIDRASPRPTEGKPCPAAEVGNEPCAQSKAGCTGSNKYWFCGHPPVPKAEEPICDNCALHWDVHYGPNRRCQRGGKEYHGPAAPEPKAGKP